MSFLIILLRIVFMLLLLLYLYKLAKDLISYLNQEASISQYNITRANVVASKENETDYCLEVLACEQNLFRIGERMFIKNLPFSIGRGPENNLVIHDPKVSHAHAIISVNSIIWLQDLNSTNGTYVNGVRISKKELSPLDKIKVGTVTLRLVRCNNEV